MTVDARSLLDAFQPPDGLMGHTAVLVTMTADPDVLDAAMVRFTGLSARARARQGRQYAYLMRDAGSWEGRLGILSPGTVPGMHELSPRTGRGAWSRLLHAKLALMAFSPNGRSLPTLARLVVSTGNYTRASMKHMLELVFTIDVQLDDVDGPGLSDIRAVAEFVRGLAERHYQFIARANPDERSPLRQFDELTRSWMKLRPAEPSTRFFHSLKSSLFEQLAARVEEQVANGRNLLLCGSGFLEQSIDAEAGPEVLEKLARLRPLGRQALRVLIVPPETTGQLRGWAERAEASGWQCPIRATDPFGLGRRLHAKYILFGRTVAERGEQTLQSGHLYLGSGNLSQRGMLASGPETHGNIECGVFFAIGAVLSPAELQSRFFWDPDAEPIEPDEWVVLEPAQGAFVPPPIACCPILHATVTDDDRLRLVWAEDAADSALVSLDGEIWNDTPQRTTSEPLTVDVIPAVLHVALIDRSQQWQVPVLDYVGRYAWTRDSFSSVGDLLATVRAYPAEDADEADDDEDADDEVTTSAKARKTEALVDRNYPLMDMAVFIEDLARQQQELEPAQLEGWFEHLERLRDTDMPAIVLQPWRASGIDLVAHLSDAAFEPAGMRARERRRYRGILQTIAERWGLQ